MNKVILLLFGLCAFVAISHVQCEVHVYTKYITAEPQIINETVESDDNVRIKLKIPGVTQILNALLTAAAKLLRQAINVLRPITPHGAAELDSILNRLEDAVENLTTVRGIYNVVVQLIGIVKDAIKAVEGLIVDVGGEAGTILKSLLSALKGLSSGLTVVKPAARIASGILG